MTNKNSSATKILRIVRLIMAVAIIGTFAFLKSMKDDTKSGQALQKVSIGR